MKISEETLDKIHDTSIITVAEKLGITLYGVGDEGRRACCPYHEDEHPSLHFSTKRGCFKCFVCGAKGDVIKLVQDKEKLSFTEACEWIIKECNIVVVDQVNHPTTVPEPAALDQRSLATIGTQEGPVVRQAHQPLLPSLPPTVPEPAEGSLTPLSPTLVTRSLSTNSIFCQSLVSQGYLTQQQMLHAANRYQLGASKEGGVIFWEIDGHQRVHTGKMMFYQPDCHRDKTHNPTWVHSLMKDKLPQDYNLKHCLFGLHLLGTYPDPLMGRGYLNERATGGAVKPSNIEEGLDGVDVSFSSFLCAREKDKLCAIVESEKTAIILSELFPDFVWLSCGGLQMFKPELLKPLVNHKIIIFPDTDENGEAFNAWTAIAQQAQNLYPFKHPLRISNILELHATPNQKRCKIDLVDYLYESKE